MSSAPVQRDLTTKTQSAVRRGAPSGAIGARKVTSPEASTVGGGGQKEVFVETWDEDIALARGYAHITFDPDGTYV